MPKIQLIVALFGFLTSMQEVSYFFLLALNVSSERGFQLVKFIG